MSSLKDIMDVDDVEPLQSQAYRRTREAQQQEASRPNTAQPSNTSSAPIDEDDDSDDDDDDDDDNNNNINNLNKTPIKRRRSNRGPAGSSTASRSIISHRRNSATGDSMDYSSSYQLTAGSSQASSSSTPQHMSRTLEPGAEALPVKYTPVTGRISRAKKGVRVHPCDKCRPAKIFSRAEHLRRHQLSHQTPAYPCTFENCERAFHRPDLLTRHMLRHETQGEKPYISGEHQGSRASSSASESLPHSLKTENAGQAFGVNTGNGGNQTSASDAAAAPRTTASGEASMTASSASAINPLFQSVDYQSSSANTSNKRTASAAQLSDLDPYPVASPRSSRVPVSFDRMTSNFPGRASVDLPAGEIFSRAVPAGFENLYAEGTESPFTSNYTTTPHLPLLRIPDDVCSPNLPYTQENSPWCSSASDSTFSNYSEGSRRHWGPRGRSGSMADWPVSATSQWSPQAHGISTTPRDLHDPQFEFLEQYDAPYTSPRMSSTSRMQQHLDVPSSFGRYNLESVGTPALSTNCKPISQVFPASPSGVSDLRLASINASRSKKQLNLGVLYGCNAAHAAANSHINAISNFHGHTQPLDIYIDSYWQHFHPLFPVIHRPTSRPDEAGLLTSALAAIGTQYHNTTEARAKGSELNETCRRSIDLCLNWNLETMQAILLTEIFSRFRGRKITARLSRRFEDLCGRLVNGPDKAPLCTSPGKASSVDSIRNRFAPPDEINNEYPDLSTRWQQWAETECRQRMLTACFIFDVHQSLYQQQPRSKALVSETRPFLSLLCSDNLWDAATASEWQQHQPNYTSNQASDKNISAPQTSTGGPFSQSLLICSLATQLPMGESPAHFRSSPPEYDVSDLLKTLTTSPLAQTYLALHYTPLHDLLAVAGDTWRFAQKVTPLAVFHEAQKRLKIWASSHAAAEATQHACRVLSLSLAQPHTHPNQWHANELACVTNYWSLYVSALICWAFGHRHQIASSGNGDLSQSNPSTAIAGRGSSQTNPVDDAKHRAKIYLNGMLKLSVADLAKSKASFKGDTACIMDAVGYQLQLDSIGGKSGMLVDCIGVLSKISKSRKGKWF